MLSNLKINKMHNVEYFGSERTLTTRSFGLYVFGRNEFEQPYSVLTKRRLYSCLLYVKQYLREEDLVAIYFDVLEGSTADFPGFERLSADLNKKLFSKVLFCDLESVLQIDYLQNQLFDLTRNIQNLEFFDLEGNLFQVAQLSLNQLLGV